MVRDWLKKVTKQQFARTFLNITIFNDWEDTILQNNNIRLSDKNL